MQSLLYLACQEYHLSHYFHVKIQSIAFFPATVLPCSSYYFFFILGQYTKAIVSKQPILMQLWLYIDIYSHKHSVHTFSKQFW